MNTDILSIGAGPAGIFTAMELLRRGSRKKILLVEKGRAVEERRCPKATAAIASKLTSAPARIGTTSSAGMACTNVRATSRSMWAVSSSFSRA